MNPGNSNDAITKEIVIQAPAQRIFLALTDPLQRLRWWKAAGKFETTQMESDLRPGGAWLMRGTAMGNKPFILSGTYITIEPPRLLEFTWFEDSQENAPPTRVRFDLQESDGSTTVRLTHSGFTSDGYRKRYQGWPWLLALLQEYVQDNKGL